MDIIIHGTKGGRRIFTPKKISGLLDVSADISKASAIGKYAYAIRYTTDGSIFSKYRIIRDVRGDKRTGYIGFSLFLSKNECLSGNEILNLLDRVSDEYSNKYIVSDNLSDVSEDWDFLDKITNEFQEKIAINSSLKTKDCLSGSKDDAIIYYSDLDELCRYFDAPHQSEYYDYRQILFIIKSLKGTPESPLNALRNSGVELHVDLENRSYYLSNYNYKDGVEITANGIPRSNERHKNEIRAKDHLVIRYSKEDQCFELIEVKGKLSDPESSDIYNYLIKTSENDVKINYEAFRNPKERIKVIQFDIKHPRKENIDNLHIKCSMCDSAKEKQVLNREAEFKGLELKECWKVSARIGAYSGEKKFTPNKVDEVVQLELIEHKKIKIIVKDRESDDSIWIFDIFRKDGKRIIRNDDELEFVGSEIDEKIQLKIRSDDYLSEEITLTPSKIEKEEIIRLNKRKKSTGEKGGDIDPQPPRIPPFVFYSLITTAILALILTGYLLIPELFPQKPENGEEYVAEGKTETSKILQIDKALNYIDGDDFRLGNLNKLKNDLKIINSKELSDTSVVKQLTETQKKVDDAIKLRKMIDSLDFANLRKMSYSEIQRPFNEMVNKIKRNNEARVRERLVDVTNLSLKQIADSVAIILHSLESPINERVLDENHEVEINEKGKSNLPNPEKLYNKTMEPGKRIGKPTSEMTSKEETPNKSKDVKNQIIQYIKGNQLDVDLLNKYSEQRGINENLKKSIKLCIQFWELDGKNNNTYFSFKQKVVEDPNLKDSKLLKLLELLCQKEKPSYRGQDKRTQLDNL